MNISRLLLSGALAVGLLWPAASLAQQSSGTVTGPAATAQPDAGHGHGGGMMAALHDLNLSDAQVQQIKQIHDQYRQAHPPGSPHDPQAMQAMRQAVLNVLTPAQRTQFEAKMQALRAQYQSQNNGAAPAQAPSSPPPH
jgi:Spy/CpxP family protein refolding chaperone